MVIRLLNIHIVNIVHAVDQEYYCIQFDVHCTMNIETHSLIL